MPASSAGGGHPPGLVKPSVEGKTLRGGEEVAGDELTDDNGSIDGDELAVEDKVGVDEQTVLDEILSKNDARHMDASCIAETSEKASSPVKVSESVTASTLVFVSVLARCRRFQRARRPGLEREHTLGKDHLCAGLCT